MAQILAALAAGLLFGGGLSVSQMVNPAKVLNFLDVTGNWDPSLALVLAGAAGTATLGYRLVRRRDTPLFAEGFQVPTARGIDRPLLLGSAIFGIGWGLAGLCPGPAIAALALDPFSVVPFVISMLVGMVLFGIQTARPLLLPSRARSDRAHGGAG